MRGSISRDFLTLVKRPFKERDVRIAWVGEGADIVMLLTISSLTVKITASKYIKTKKRESPTEGVTFIPLLSKRRMQQC